MVMRYCSRWLPTMKSGDGREIRLLKVAWLVVILLGIVFAIQVMDYRTTVEKHNELAIEMEAYSNLAAKVNDSPCRAVQSEQMPMVFADIIHKGNDFGLVVKTGEKPLYQDDTASIYEMHLKGSWKRTVMYLENMQTKDALLSLRMLDMHGTDENLETKLQIKIYKKG
ncbi:MAG: hypothetical protein K6F95_11965 [Selenomonas sp.]|uniref:hypothetical protein n=1 Tax=Selenomonas sp. TaxID=2053611 RepID=UPI0025D5542A|nr:hypothetical protein [Selenomonas sp.]MCR5758604.1 hypothetical protein [Selenomonas sp.]